MRKMVEEKDIRAGIISGFLAVLCMLTLWFVSSDTVKAAEVVRSGSFTGEGYIQWVLDSDGVLTFSGNGGVYPLLDNLNLAVSIAPDVREIVFEEGTWPYGFFNNFSIYDHCEELVLPFSDINYGGAFQYMTSLKKVTTPDGITSLDAECFMGCASLTEESFLFSSDLKEIGARAFKECTGLTSVTIPEGCEKIGEGAFEGCTSLRSIKLPSHAEYGGFVFRNCTSLNSLDLSALSVIPNDFAAGCTSLTSVAFSEQLTVITLGAFSGCTHLQMPMLPSSLTEIEDNAFAGCMALGEVVIPPSVLKIGGAFQGSSVTDISIHGDIGISFRLGIFGEAGSDTLRSAVITSGSGKVAGGLFKNCTALTAVQLPSGLKSIEAGAFMGCSSLTSINLPEGMESIGEDAFSDCIGLKDLVFPDSVNSLGGSYNLSSLTELRFPSGLSLLPSGFYDCANLENVYIPAGMNCDTTLSLRFSRCPRLKAFHVDKANPYLCDIDGVLYDKSVKTLISVPGARKSLIIPSGVTKIAYYAAEHRPGLEEISIPGTVSDFHSYAFWGCTSIRRVLIREGVTRVGYGAFTGAGSIKALYLPSTLQTIDGLGFNAESIEKIYYGGGEASFSAIQINDGSSSVTTDWQKLRIESAQIVYHASEAAVAITENPDDYKEGGSNPGDDPGVDPGDDPGDGTEKVIQNGFLTETLTWRLTEKGVLTISGTGAMRDDGSIPWDAWKDDITRVVIEEGVTAIGDSAFAMMDNMTSVNIPEGVTRIGDGAFLFCWRLEEVELPSTLTRIEDRAFGGMAFKAITLPDSLVHIGAKAFNSNSKLKSITIPAGVKKIEDSVFYGCRGLSSITLPNGLSAIGQDAFSDCGSLMDVYYGGTAAEWAAVVISGGNAALQSATIHYDGNDQPENPGVEDPVTEPVVTKLFLDKTSLTIPYAGSESVAKITATAQSDSAVFSVSPKLTWAVDKESIALLAASVSGTGAKELKDSAVCYIQGKASGKAVVTVSYKSAAMTKAVSAKVAVTVKPAVTKIFVSGPEFVTAGGNISLKATVEPPGAMNKKVRWEVVSDATESDSGSAYFFSPDASRLIGSARGQVKVRAVSTDGTEISSNIYTVQVMAPAKKVTLSAFTMKTQESVNLQEMISITPEDAHVEWKSDSVEIADKTVLSASAATEPFTLTALKAGKTKVSLKYTTDEAKKNAQTAVKTISATITVADEPEVKGFKVLSQILDLSEDQPGLISVQTKPVVPGAKISVFSSDNKGKALSSSKLRISAAEGQEGYYTVFVVKDADIKQKTTEYITVTSGEKAKKTFKLTIFPKVSGLELIQGNKAVNSPISMNVNKSLTLKAALTGGISAKNVSWTSSASEVAVVDEKSGKITAKGPGKAEITCRSTENAGKSAMVEVEVSVPVTKLVLSAAKTSAKADSTGKAVGTLSILSFTPENTTDTKVSWTVSAVSKSTLQKDSAKNAFKFMDASGNNLTDGSKTFTTAGTAPLFFACAEPGVYTIKATAGKKSAACQVTITQ